MANQQKNYETAYKLGLPEINIPRYDIKIRPSATTRQYDIYDPIRGKWVALTPEEWVRQHFVNFLIEHRGYQASRIANEVSLKLNDTLRRADTIIYNHLLHPEVIIEYKAPQVALTPEVAEQVLRYNLVLGAAFVIVTNGKDVYTIRCDVGGNFAFIHGVPSAENI